MVVLSDERNENPYFLGVRLRTKRGDKGITSSLLRISPVLVESQGMTTPGSLKGMVYFVPCPPGGWGGDQGPLVGAGLCFSTSPWPSSCPC